MVNFEQWERVGIGYWLNGNKPKIVTKICNDTRKLAKDTCFIAIKTEYADGHDFLLNAEQRDASCAIVSRINDTLRLPQFVCKNTINALRKIAVAARSAFQGNVIGITGSMGKTSTKDVLSLIVGVENNRTFLNENNELGVPLTLARLNNFEKFGIVELGIGNFGDMDKLLDFAHPTDCILTGVSKIHLDTFASKDEIAAEKCKLAEYVVQNHGISIFSEELLVFKCFRNIAADCIIPSRKKRQNIWFSVVDNPNGGRNLNISIHGSLYGFELPHLMSDGMVKNFMLAAVYALLAGEEYKSIAQRLKNWTPSFLRGTITVVGGRTFFADCYNANPDAFADSLANFNRLFPNCGRLFIIGCFLDYALGTYSEIENIALAKQIPLLAGDEVIVIGQNAKIIRDEIVENNEGTVCHCLETSEQAKKLIESFTGVVYLKGHHCYHLENLIF